MSALEVTALGVAIAIALVLVTFWIAMIRDCWLRTPPGSRERYVWLLIVILGKLPGATAYYFLRDRNLTPGAPEPR